MRFKCLIIPRAMTSDLLICEGCDGKNGQAILGKGEERQNLLQTLGQDET